VQPRGEGHAILLISANDQKGKGEVSPGTLAGKRRFPKGKETKKPWQNRRFWQEKKQARGRRNAWVRSSLNAPKAQQHTAKVEAATPLQKKDEVWNLNSKSSLPKRRGRARHSRVSELKNEDELRRSIGKIEVAQKKTQISREQQVVPGGGAWSKSVYNHPSAEGHGGP